MKPSTRLRSFLALTSSALLAAPAIQASTLYWDGGTGVWGTTTFWSTDPTNIALDPVATPISTDDVVFSSTSAAAQSIAAMNADRAAQSLTFSTSFGTLLRAQSAAVTARSLTIGSGGITINSGSGAVTINDTPGTYGVLTTVLGASQSWTHNDDSLFTVAGPVNLGVHTLTLAGSGTGGTTLSNVISGTGGLTVNRSGSGVVTLSNNASTYSGQLTVARGTISIASINNVSANGTLGNSANAVILGSSGQTGTLQYTGTSTGGITKPFILAAGGTGVFDVTGAGTNLQIDFTGNSGIYGSGNLTKAGLGTLTLIVPDANSNQPEPQYTGVTQFAVGGGRIKYATGGFNNGDEYILFNSAFDTTNTSASVGLDITGATNPWFGGLLGNVALGTAVNVGYTSVASVNLNVRAANSYTYGGIIANGAANMQLTKQGYGTQILTNANTYSGATTVRAGTLALAGASGTALNSAFTVRGGTLELDNSTNLVASRLADATAISLGSLTLKGFNTGGVQGETVGATTFAVGGKITVINGSTAGDRTNLTLGAVTRSTGAAIDFVGGGLGTLGGGANSPNVTSSSWPALTNGILPWATVGGTQWATTGANGIVAFTPSFTTLAAATSTTQAQQTGAASPSGSAIATNSLNVISDGTSNILNLGNNVVSFGSTNTTGTVAAILKSGANPYTISASGTGSLRAGTGGAGTEFIAHVDGGALTISAPLSTTINNIAKGGTGDLILSGTRSTNFTNTGFISIAGGQLEFQGASTTISGLITGAGGLTANLNAGQILTINNTANSYSGPTIVKGGILRTGNAFNSIGFPGGQSRAGLSNLQINNGIVSTPYVNAMYLGAEGGQFQITGGTAGFSGADTLSFFVNSRSVYEIVWGASGEGAATGYFNPSVFVLGDQTSSGGAITWNSGFDLNGTTRTISNTATAYSSTITGTIRNSSGTAGLTKTGAGSLILSSANTYNGANTISAGTLQFAKTASLYNGTTASWTAANIVVANTGTLALNVGGAGEFTTGDVTTLLTNLGGANGTSTTGFAAGSSIGFDTTNASGTSFTVANNIANSSGSGGGAMGVTKLGTNMLVLSGNNTYTGSTTLTAGTLVLTGSLSGSSVSLTGGDFAASGSISGTGVTFTKASTNTGTSILSGTNTYTGGTTISGGTLAFAKTASMPASGTVAVQTGANIGIGLGGTGEWTTGTSGSGTLGGLLTGTGGQGNSVTYAGTVGINLITTGSQSYGVIANATGSTHTGLVKSGNGTLTLNGANSYTGSTTLNAGTLKLDYAASNLSKLSNTASVGTLTLNGGTLELSGGTHLETVLSTTVSNGTTFVTQTNSGTAKLSMGAISFNGGAIDFSAPGIATTSTGVTTGILNQRATVAGANFAMKSGSDIVAYDYVTNGVTGYTGAAMAANTNYALTASGTSTLAGTTGATTNTLKIANASAGSLAVGANTLTVGTILFAGSADYNITTSGTGRVTPTILHNYGTGGAVLNLGTLGGPLTQYGTGKTILTSTVTAVANAGLNIFGGTVQVSTNAQIGIPAAGVGIALNNGTLLASETLALNNAGANHRAITLGAQGGTLAAAATKTLTVSGVISGFGNPLTIGGASSTGTVTLTAYNTYTGTTTVSNGTLVVNGNISTSVLTTVESGATIGGTGTTGVLTINNGGIFAPGNSPGTINSGTLTLNSTSISAFELNPSDTTVGGGINDLGNVTGDLTLDGVLNVTATSGNFLSVAINTAWRLFNYTGTFTDNTLSLGSMPSLSSGLSWSIDTATSGQVNLVVVPEPRAALLGGIGLLLLLRRRR